MEWENEAAPKHVEQLPRAQWAKPISVTDHNGKETQHFPFYTDWASSFWNPYEELGGEA
jgi:hypothetical protein